MRDDTKNVSVSLLTESDHEYAHERGICVDSCPHCAKDRALNETLHDRGQEYGDYTHMAYVAQMIKSTMREGESWPKMTDVQRESLDLIATKLARIVCGNPHNPDSWLDVEGYAKLVRDRIPLAPAIP